MIQPKLKGQRDCTMQEASAIWWADLEQKHILWSQNRRRWRWQELAHSRRASIFQALFQKWPAYCGCTNSWYHPEHDKTPPPICRQICISPPKLWNGYNTMQQLNNSPSVLLVACLQEEQWWKKTGSCCCGPSCCYVYILEMETILSKLQQNLCGLNGLK